MKLLRRQILTMIRIWIQIRIGLAPWIRIRIEISEDPQHCCYNIRKTPAAPQRSVVLYINLQTRGREKIANYCRQETSSPQL
jgi:hypothetical protein